MGNYGHYSGKGYSSTSNVSRVKESSNNKLEQVIELLQKVNEAQKTVEKKAKELEVVKKDYEQTRERVEKEIAKLDPSLVATIKSLFSKSNSAMQDILKDMDDEGNSL